MMFLKMKIEIQPYLASEDTLYDNVNNWADEVVDLSVVYLKRLIASGFRFTEEMWTGGVHNHPMLILVM